ncbi:hypothetical protein GCM10018790_14570 [Kitasatospora xanthocidica]|nr:hypothetical protein GCM10018790_14570 [Kitasatospora xanthocidica]
MSVNQESAFMPGRVARWPRSMQSRRTTAENIPASLRGALPAARTLDVAILREETPERTSSNVGGRAVKRAERAADGAAHAVRLLPVLTCRRHIDLQRVCSSMA